MKHADKNRDPERARKRAVADARCALRKLDLLSELESMAADHDKDSAARVNHRAYLFTFRLAEALGVRS